MAEDFAKAMALGADAIALSNSAMQAVGCIAARMCNSNNCPVGVATQKPELRKRLDVQIGAEKLARYFGSSVELMQVLARACGRSSLSDFHHSDITTWKREMADLSGVNFAGPNLWQFAPERVAIATGAPLPECTSETATEKSYRLIKEIYAAEGSTEQSVPILYDKKTKRIVNNESAEIIRMLDRHANALGANMREQTYLYPQFNL